MDELLKTAKRTNILSGLGSTRITREQMDFMRTGLKSMFTRSIWPGQGSVWLEILEGSLGYGLAFPSLAWLQEF